MNNGSIKRLSTTPSALDALYLSWEQLRYASLYDDLLRRVTDKVFLHYRPLIGYEDADIVSSEAALRVCRALPGHVGTGGLKPLKTFSKEQGRFCSFVARVGRSTVQDYFKALKRQKNGNSRDGQSLVAFVAESKVEHFEWASEDPWHSKGRSHTKKTPDEEYYYEK
jgi:hypothetical protein